LILFGSRRSGGRYIRRSPFLSTAPGPLAAPFSFPLGLGVSIVIYLSREQILAALPSKLFLFPRPHLAVRRWVTPQTNPPQPEMDSFFSRAFFSPPSQDLIPLWFDEARLAPPSATFSEGFRFSLVDVVSSSIAAGEQHSSLFSIFCCERFFLCMIWHFLPPTEVAHFRILL